MSGEWCETASGLPDTWPPLAVSQFSDHLDTPSPTYPSSTHHCPERESNPQTPGFKPGRSSDWRIRASSGGWNRTNGLLGQSQASLPTATAPECHDCGFRIADCGLATTTARGEGFEPPSPGSKPGGLPLADPRKPIRNPQSTIKKLRQEGSNLHPLLNRQVDYRYRIPESQSGRWDLNPRSPVPETGGFPGSPTSCATPLTHSPLTSEHPAGVEPALPPWQGSKLPLHHGCVAG